MQYTSEEMDRKFAREFKSMIAYRNAYMANNRAFAVENLPIPKNVSEASLFDITSPGQKYALIHEITEPYFSELNEHYVEICPTGMNFERVCLDTDGTPIRDTEGKLVTRKVIVPRNSVVIATTVNIHLPNYVKDANGENVKYEIKDKSYAYLTCMHGATPRYYYAVPQTVVYTAHPVSLVLSARARRQQAYYNCYRLLMQNGSYVYLTTMLTERITATTDMRIVCSKLSTDFNKEIRSLWNCWQRTVAFQQPDGRSFPYCFSPIETRVMIDGTPRDLAFMDMSSVSTSLDTSEYYATEQTPISETQNESDV